MGMDRTIGALLRSPFVSQKLRFFGAFGSQNDLLVLQKLVERGAVKPIIDRSYPLSQTPEAVAYVEGGHARGKVVITVPMPSRLDEIKRHQRPLGARSMRAAKKTSSCGT